MYNVDRGRDGVKANGFRVRFPRLTTVEIRPTLRSLVTRPPEVKRFLTIVTVTMAIWSHFRPHLGAFSHIFAPNYHIWKVKSLRHAKKGHPKR